MDDFLDNLCKASGRVADIVSFAGTVLIVIWFIVEFAKYIFGAK